MYFLTIAKKDVMLLLRDRKALLTLVGTPLILTFILGMAFQGMWSSEQPPSRVLWINEDTGEWGKMLFEEVMTREGITEWTTLEEAIDAEQALDEVRRGRATAFIEIPADFSQAVVEGNAVITVAGDPASSIRANIITRIVQRFAAEMSSRRVIHTALNSYDTPLPHEDVEAALAGVQMETRTEGGVSPAAEDDVVVPMDYYAAGMGVMYLLFTVSHGAGTFLKEREMNTLARMYQTPVQGWEIGAGKFAGIFITASLQITAVIIFAGVVYGVAWGDPLGVAALSATAVFAASGIGLLIAAVSKSPAAADALGTAVVLPMAVMGGSMIPLFAMPPVMRSLSKVTVNGWALDGYVRLMFEGAGVADLLSHMLVLLGMGVLFILLSGFLLSRKGVVS